MIQKYNIIKKVLLALICIWPAIAVWAQPVIQNPTPPRDEFVTDCIVNTAYVDGCKEGYKCFEEGRERGCPRGQDCSRMSLGSSVGDNKCHKVCKSTSDCPPGFKCLEKQAWHGDAGNVYHFCLVE